MRTKIDLAGIQKPLVSENEIQDFISKTDAVFHIKTSAKTGENVKELFDQLCNY